MTESNKNKLTVLLAIMVFGLTDFIQVEGVGYVFAESNEIVTITDAVEMSSILDELGSVTQTNFEKIKTLKGQIQNQTITTYVGEKAQNLLKQHTKADPKNLPNKIQRIIDSTIQFKINMKKDQFFSVKNYVEPYLYLDMESDTMYPSSMFLGELIQIVSPEHKIEITPLSKPKNNVVKDRIAIKKLPSPVRRIDPRDVYYVGNSTLWETLSRFSEVIQQAGVKTRVIVIKKISKDSHVIYHVEAYLPGKEQLASVIVLDSEVGFNFTSIENWREDGTRYSKITNKFVNIKGIYLPVEREVLQFFEDGDIMRHDHYTIEHQQANTSIPDSVFSEFTYLKDGDQYNDKIKNKKYKVKSGKLVEFEEQKKEKARKKGNYLFDDVAQETNSSLYVVSSTPELPVKLKLEERLVFDVFYDLPKEFKHAKIWARPYTKGKSTPGYEAHQASRVSEKESSGVVECWFTFEKPATVDEVRIVMVDMSGNKIHSGSMPIDAEWVNDK